MASCTASFTVSQVAGVASAAPKATRAQMAPAAFAGAVGVSAKVGSVSSSMFGSTTALSASTRVVRAAAPKAVSAEAETVTQQKIRIKLKAYNTGLIEAAGAKILDAAAETGAAVSGPVPLPTRRRIYCVLRSPHVNKDSREHFEIRTHQRLIDLKNPSAQTIDALMQLDLPAGVDIEVKL